MALRICLPLLNHNLCRDSYRPTSSCPRTLFGISLPRAAFVSTPRRNSESSHNDLEEDALGSHCLSKRKFNLVILAAVSYGFVLTMKKATLAEQLELERYTDSKEGFTLLRPSSWNKVDKAGATVLFEEPNKGSNNVGVVVNSVRLSNLGEFGSPQFVADKLIQAERRKLFYLSAEEAKGTSQVKKRFRCARL